MKKNISIALFCALFGAVFTGKSVRAESDAVSSEVIANLVRPTVVTNYNKYGDDVVTITGFVTNGYTSIAAALDAFCPGDSIALVTNVQETVSIPSEGAFIFDLNGFKLSPSAGETNVLLFAGTSSNSTLSVVSGTLSGNLRFGSSGTEPVNVGYVVLGPALESDGDIFATGDVQVLLQDGFRSTYTNGVFSTEIPLQAEEGAYFGYRHNPRDARLPGKLVFPEPDLQLVSRDGGFMVTQPPLLKQWSYDLSHWLEDIPPDTPISRICVPASHDSAIVRGKSSFFSFGAGNLLRMISSQKAYVTQSLDIGSQLECGCRKFDVRLHVCDDNVLRAYHAPDEDSSCSCVSES